TEFWYYTDLRSHAVRPIPCDVLVCNGRINGPHLVRMLKAGYGPKCMGIQEASNNENCEQLVADLTNKARDLHLAKRYHYLVLMCSATHMADGAHRTFSVLILDRQGNVEWSWQLQLPIRDVTKRVRDRAFHLLNAYRPEDTCNASSD
ncbi:MAG: hypothetical protein WCG94_09080, partial [Methanothrix sp.]